MLNLPHRVKLPSTSTLAPAIVLVHGWKGNENVMWAFENVLPPRAVIVSPRAPLAVGKAGYGWFLKKDDGAYESAATGVEALEKFITELPAHYPVDPQRMYLMGFSQGAALCYLYALANSQHVAGLVSLMGFLPEYLYHTLTPNSFSQLPLLMLTGTEDAKVPLAQARATHQALLKTGAALTYKEYDTGHKLNAQGMRDLKQWLSEQVGR